MAEPWYSRCVLFVANAEASYRHYVEVLGFSGGWRHDENGVLLVGQVERDGLEIILTQDQERAGKGRIFVNPNHGESQSVADGVFRSGGSAQRGMWGMPVMMIRDLDGNELFFNDDQLNATLTGAEGSNPV